MGPAYGLATQLSADTPQIRAALREPLDDPDEETREEAVCGLAKRRDEVAFEPLLEYLRSGFAGTGCIDAAGAWGDLRFVDALAAIRETQPSVANSAAGALRVIREANPRTGRPDPVTTPTLRPIGSKPRSPARHETSNES
jgi:HEAT repeat protein